MPLGGLGVPNIQKICGCYRDPERVCQIQKKSFMCPLKSLCVSFAALLHIKFLHVDSPAIIRTVCAFYLKNGFMSGLYDGDVLIGRAWSLIQFPFLKNRLSGSLSLAIHRRVLCMENSFALRQLTHLEEVDIDCGQN